jgi:hypothetical protein
MSRRRTAILAAIFLVLGGYFVVFEGLSLERAKPEWEGEAKILPCPADGIREIRVAGPNGEVTGEREGEGWKISPGHEPKRPAELALDSLAAALCDLPVIDTIESPQSFADFGLDPAPIEVQVASGHWNAKLGIGEFTPARNLLYARKGDRPEVLKIGALLRSEIDKVLAYAEPAAGEPQK